MVVRFHCRVYRGLEVFEGLIRSGWYRVASLTSDELSIEQTSVELHSACGADREILEILGPFWEPSN